MNIAFLVGVVRALQREEARSTATWYSYDRAKIHGSNSSSALNLKFIAIVMGNAFLSVRPDVSTERIAYPQFSLVRIARTRRY